MYRNLRNMLAFYVGFGTSLVFGMWSNGLMAGEYISEADIKEFMSIHEHVVAGCDSDLPHIAKPFVENFGYVDAGDLMVACIAYKYDSLLKHILKEKLGGDADEI